MPPEASPRAIRDDLPTVKNLISVKGGKLGGGPGRSQNALVHNYWDHCVGVPQGLVRRLGWARATHGSGRAHKRAPSGGQTAPQTAQPSHPTQQAGLGSDPFIQLDLATYSKDLLGWSVCRVFATRCGWGNLEASRFIDN